MGRFKEDFSKIYKGMGLNNALLLVFIPRILRKIGIKYDDNLAYNRFIEKNFNKVALKYRQVVFSTNTKIPKTIWVFWWQGELAMPPVIKECYKSILRNCNG